MKNTDRAPFSDSIVAWTLDPRLYGRGADPARISKRIAQDENFKGNPRSVANFATSVRNRMRQAERFKLTPEFVRQAVHLSTPQGKTTPSQVERAIHLARNPFPVSWWEWDCRVMLQEKHELGVVKTIEPDCPTRIGALLVCPNPEDASIWAWQFWVEQQTHTAPIMFTGFVSTDGTVTGNSRLWRTPSGQRLRVDSNKNRFKMIMGQEMIINGISTRNMGHDDIEWDPLNRVSVDLDDYNFANLYLYQKDAQYSPEDRLRGIPDQVLSKALDTELNEWAGTIRYLTTILALVNSTKIRYHEIEAQGRHLVYGRSVPYLSHRTVKIEVPEGTRFVTRYLTRRLSEASRRRAHMVRGYWRYRGTPRELWVDRHQRGDATLGWVRQDHEVTT